MFAQSRWSLFLVEHVFVDYYDGGAVFIGALSHCGRIELDFSAYTLLKERYDFAFYKMRILLLTQMNNSIDI